MKTELPTPSPMNSSTRYSSPSSAQPMPGTNGVTARPSIASLEARVRRYNADINTSSATFRAAVLLLAAAEYGRNIDGLSRRTGYPRSLVAKCARRLIDNGVWTPQGGLLTEWSPADEASGAFWNDVAVAEGKLCRRVNAAGEIEWAPPGFWNKSYEFIDAAAKSQLGAVYRDPTAITEVTPDPDADDDDDDDGARVPDVPPTSTAPATDPTDTAPPAAPTPVPATPVGTQPPQPVMPEAPSMHRPTPPPLRPARPPIQRPAEIFPDTVWIG